MTPYQLIAKKISDSESLEDLAEGLEHILSGGYGVCEDGELYSIRHLVAKVNGLTIEIYSNEHPPPHFHVKGGGINVSFSIEDCSLLNGKINRNDEKLIEWWHKQGKNQLIEIWNSE